MPYSRHILWIEDSDNSIIISDNVTIEGAHIAVTGKGKKVTIGNDCMISYDVTFRTGDSHAIIQNGKKINDEKDIELSEHIWTGQGVTILKGVHIASNSIVGNGSLVTHAIESYTLNVGFPSHVIKNNINWSRQRFL